MEEQIVLSWAAGFFDGEGCTYLQKARPYIKIDQNDREVLDKFLLAVGLGSVYGPFHPPTVKNPRFEYQATGKKAIIVLVKLWPYLGSAKRTQAEGILSQTIFKSWQKNYRGGI